MIQRTTFNPLKCLKYNNSKRLTKRTIVLQVSFGLEGQEVVFWRMLQRMNSGAMLHPSLIFICFVISCTSNETSNIKAENTLTAMISTNTNGCAHHQKSFELILSVCCYT